MNITARKIGLILTSISGIVMAYLLSSIAQKLVTDRGVAWAIVVSALIVGIVFIVWGLKDLRTH